MNLRKVIQLEQVHFLSANDHSGTQTIFHPKACVQNESLVLFAPSLLQHP